MYTLSVWALRSLKHKSKSSSYLLEPSGSHNSLLEVYICSTRLNRSEGSRLLIFHITIKNISRS